MNPKPLHLRLKLTRMGWCVFLDGEAYAIGSRAYCQLVSKGLILGVLKPVPQPAPQKGGAA